MYLYTSSDMTTHPGPASSDTTRDMDSISECVNTFPVGLWGELSMTAHVLDPTFSLSFSGSSIHVPPPPTPPPPDDDVGGGTNVRGTYTGVPPANRI